MRFWQNNPDSEENQDATKQHQREVFALQMMSDDEDICGLCGQPGADKYAHPMHWPGELIPDGPLVHAACEEEECKRAHSLLTDKQRESFLRSI